MRVNDEGRAVEISRTALLESQFDHLNGALIGRGAKVVCWWGRDLVVVNVELTRGKSIGYAEHPNTLGALILADHGVDTNSSLFWYEHENEVPIGGETWIDRLIKRGGRVVFVKEGGKIRCGITRFAEQYLEIPDEVREEVYRRGWCIWENRGYTFRVYPTPALKSGQIRPVGYDIIGRRRERSALDDPEHYDLFYTGKGRTVLQALKNATEDPGTEINRTLKNRLYTKLFGR